MSSQAQIKANRENGSKSHGPVSEAGKAVSCMNNVRHGLAGGLFYFMEGENPEPYEQLHEMLEKEHEPKTGTDRTSSRRDDGAVALALAARQHHAKRLVE